MKLNEKSIKNESDINKKFDFSKSNIIFKLNNENNQESIPKSSNNSNNNDDIKINVDPRLELTLKYLDIMQTLNIFVNNFISFNDLLLLSKKDLIDLGCSLVERNRIFTFAQEYKNFGVKYNISEIHDFFNKYENLNIRLVTNNNYNRYNIMKKENIINENINYNLINNKNNNNYNDLLLEPNQINKNTEPKKNKKKNIIIKKQKNFSSNNNTSNKNKINIPLKNLINNYPSQETNYQDTINTNHNNNNLQNSSKLIRQNSKISKNSNYSKSSKSRLVTVSKIFTGGTGSNSVIQKYQNISEEIDNYFKKYNNYKEQKKNRMKRYELIGTSNKRKNQNQNMVYDDIIKENKIDENYIEENISKNREDEIKKKLLELQKRKKELKEELNLVYERENKKLMIIKYLDEEDK